jgi:PAS domain S-box-containing protein
MDDANRKKEDIIFRLVKNSRDMMYRISIPDGTYEYVSPGCLEITGYTPEKHSNAPLFAKEAIHPEWLDYFKAKWEDILKGKVDPTYEYKIIHKSGAERWVHQSNMLVCDPDGHPSALEGIVTDITDLKLIEENLRNSEKQYYLTINALADTIHVVDRDLRILLINNAFREWTKKLGLDVEAVGKKIFEVFPFLGKGIQNEYEKVFSTGDILITEETTTVGEQEIITETKKIPILEDNKVTKVITYIRNITDFKQTQAALQTSKEYAERLIQTANAMIIGLDTEGQVTIFNEAAEQITGYKYDEILGRNWFETVVPKERFPEVWKEFGRVLGGGIPQDFESPILTKSGEERFIVWKNNNLFTNDRLSQTISFGIDITDRLQTEIALRESEARFRDLIENSSDWIWEVDNEMRCIYASPRIKDVIGYSPEEVIGKKSVDFLPPEDAERISAGWDDLKRNPQPWRNLEYSAIHKDGSIRVLESNAIPLFDTKGKFLGLRGIDRDVTERKRTEHLIEESQNKFVAAFHGSPAPMVITEPSSGRIVDVNSACENWSGYTREETIGKTTIELSILNVDQREGLYREINRKGKVGFLEMKYSTKNGEIRNILTRLG